MTPLEEYYNKFNEEKRLDSRHGQIEFITSMKYIHRWLGELMRLRGTEDKSRIRIFDIGAGPGRYAIPLSEEGYDVSALELVKHNLSRMKKNGPLVKARQGNALNLKKYADQSFDLTLLFGPMYHLCSEEEKVQALKEALRVTKEDGIVLVAYIMNDYSILTYAFKERHVLEALKEGKIDQDWKCVDDPADLYSRVRLSDVERLNELAGAQRVQVISADGPANYMRREVNALTQEEFEKFIEYHLATCERPDLMGASGHIVDMIRVKKEIYEHA